MKEKIIPDRSLIISKKEYSEESFKTNFDHLKKTFERILKIKKF